MMGRTHDESEAEMEIYIYTLHPKFFQLVLIFAFCCSTAVGEKNPGAVTGRL
jgi:hypothetical protein